MRIIALLQAKNEGTKNLKEILEQAEIMSDGIILLDDASTDGSFTDEIKNHPLVLEYVKLPEKNGMFEGINMAVLLNFARKHKADWCYFPAGHYRFIGDLNNFKENVEKADKYGLTHLLLKWFTMWNDKEYRADGEWNPERRYQALVWKLQSHTWFKCLPAHCTHAENDFEVCAPMSSLATVQWGRHTLDERKKKYELYSKMGLKETFEHYVNEEGIVLKPYDERKMMEDVKLWNANFCPQWIVWNGVCYIQYEIMCRDKFEESKKWIREHLLVI
jgi:hypothetical protein